MAKKLFDHAIGGDAHVSIEVGDDGNLGLEVSYSVEKLRSPLISLLQKATAKVPFLSRQVPNLVNGLYTGLGIMAVEDVKDVTPEPAAPAPTPAHEAAPVEAAAPQA